LTRWQGFLEREDMIVEREKALLDSFKEEEVSITDGFNKKQSLVLKISLIFLGLTIVNLLVFWIATGSNQISLIMDKATLKSKNVGNSLVDQLKPLMSNPKWAIMMDDEKSVKDAQKMLVDALKKSFKKDQNNNTALESFKVINSKNQKVIFSYPNKLEKGKEITTQEEKQSILKVFQLSRLKGVRYLPKPEIFKLKAYFFIPITDRQIQDYVLIADSPMPFIWENLKKLFVIALIMVGLMLLVQVLMGFLIYKLVVKPVKNLAEGSQKIAEGNLDIQVKEVKSTDEMGMLVYMFNKMAAALKEKTGKLEGTLAELDKQFQIMMNELDMAQNIQQSLMPQKTITDKLKTSIYYAPLEKVSGDYYDMFEFEDGSIGLLMMDASGHGVPAALVTMLAKVIIARLAPENQVPGQMLSIANTDLSRAIVTSDYLTAFYYILRPDMTLDYCNGSHQFGVILRKNGEVETLDTDGFFVGAIEESPFEFETKTTKVEVGDRIIHYTDGIVEGTDPERNEYSYERFVELLKKIKDLELDEFNKKIIEDVDAFAQGEPRKDDYTLFSIEVMPQALEASKIAPKSKEASSVRKVTNESKPRTSEAVEEKTDVVASSALKDAMKFYKEHDFEKAKDFFGRVIADEPTNDSAKLYYANSVFYLKDYWMALELLETYMETNTENAYAHLKLGVCYAKSDQDDRAIEQYKKAIMVNSKLAEAYGQLGISLANKGELESAKENIEKALEIKPGDNRLKKLHDKLMAKIA